MAWFEGRIRDLGEVPGDAFEHLLSMLDTHCDDFIAGDGRFLSKHPDAKHVVLRFPDEYPRSHMPASYTERWPVWRDAVTPIIEHLAVRCGRRNYGLAKVLLSALAPGGTIGRHVDENPSSAIPQKIHVPLRTDPNVAFTIDGVAYYLEPGRAYEINNLLPHSVANRSSVERIHLVVEIYSEDVAAARRGLDAAVAVLGP